MKAVKDGEWINNVSVPELTNFLRQCCGCEKWIRRMVIGRPYESPDALLKAAEVNWERLDESDYLQAFEAHPMIGDIHSLPTKDVDTKALSADEQSRVATAQHETLDKLAEMNAKYKARFGFVFIVCAMDKSAEEILELLQDRLGNTKDEEIRQAAREQSQITRHRLEKML